MRRTYRSKKETGGALDHKDVMNTLDEKSSAFDAFYIQNIKQTKRELSCIGSSSHYGVAANKVRKRKYVKRIVKDPEPTVSSSPLQSAFLTPDKSLRVNKGQDLFDQLLNSSTPRQNGSPKDSLFKSRRFPARQEGKTYTRKFAKVKKYNCSSSDSVDSDIENSNDDCELQNVTDLRSYNLVIERERKPSPKYLDESINKIVKNISALNCINFHRDTSIDSAKKSFSNVRHRLTSHIQSPSNSPLCSTPFKEKYRSQSIYKFSPISFGKNDVSTDCLTIVEDDGNESVVFVDKKCESLQKSNSDDMAPSPIIHLSKNINLKTEVLKENSPISETEAVTPKLNDIKTDELHSKTVEISSIEINDFQTTEVEPFLGFSNIKLHENQSTCNKDETKSIINGPESDNVKNSNIILENISCDVINNTDNSLLSEPEEVEKENDSSYDTCNSEQSSLHNIEVIKIPVVKIEKLNNSVLEKYLDKLSACKSNNSTVNDSDDYASLESSESSLCGDDSRNGLSEESEYEMPSVEKSSNDESEIEDIESDESDSNRNSEEERCDIESEERDSYRHTEEKRCDIESDERDSYRHTEEERCDIESDERDCNRNSEEERCDIESDERDSNRNSEEERCDIESDERDSNRNSEEERCISFVTTRKRNEVINDSLIFGFNNSFGSGSSTDCDKTVLSNNNEKTKIQASLSPNVSVTPGENVNTEVLNISAENDDLKESEKENCADTTRISSITRKILKLPTENNISISKSIMDEGKPGIVLQPGKKWERSLSIYRRMTMMTDHFDQSILDDDEFNNKGRKFRQSVISTMELQDKSSLHNESIISRRSTFVSKPCRSTIRIIKEPNTSRLSLCTTAVSEDLVGFLNEECDDTIVELSKLSIADSAHEVTVIENIHDTSNRVSTARDYVLRRCGQSDAIPFDECYPEALLKNCRKIGEGVYGEVFLWRARDGRARVMKIVPIAGTTKVNGEHQKDFQEIISEIVIAMELSALRAPINEIQREFDEGKSIDSLDLHSVENATDVFNEVLAVRCVYGAYPSRLLDLWELYDECNGSENDNPAVLPVDQQYIVLELANAGQDLESYEFNSAEQAHALFLQVAFGLAVAEEAFQFEHRDLHWGNVLIAPTDQKFATFVLRGRAHRVARCGVAGTVIDYSLSRLSLPLPAAGDAAALYNDLAHDDGLFDAVGDYQFQVYRLMREKLGNDWKNFEPYTNILWLHYTVDKMITALRYKRTNTKIHKHYIAKLKGIKNRILDYGSAAQFVLTDNEF